MIAQYVKLSMIPSGVMPTLYVSQYDVGRPLGLIVTNGTELVDMDSYSITIEATRSDGTQITAAVTTADNIGTFQTTATMTNVAGIYKAQLVIAIASGKRIASIPFLMNVTAAAMDENGQGIAEDQSLYQQYTGTVQTLIATIRADLNTEIANRQSAVSAEAAARQTADNTLQSNINSEASTRAAADQNLQAQISQIVAPSGEAPSAAEVQNARVGADGVTYSTLGDAIRANDSQLKSHLDAIDSELTTTITQSTQYITFAFEVGSQYVLINDTNNSMNAHTYTAPSASGTAVEVIGTNIQAGQSKIFTPTVSASYARFYCNGRGTVTVKNISYGVPKLEIDVSALQANAETYVQKNGFQQVNERNTTFFTQTLNLFNKETVLDNYDLKQDGSGLYVATGYMATEEYIDVSNLNSIKALAFINGAVSAVSIRYVLYNANKTALNQRTITNAVIDTSNASYLRFGASLGSKDILMVVPGDATVTEYIPYGFKFNYAEEKEVTLVEINPTDDIIQKLLDNKGKDIHFNAGDYDIIAQYEAHFGSDYFTNYTDYTSGGDNLGRGLPVYRDTRVTFSQGAVFSANYTGGNAAVRTNFSAFWLESGVTVDGLRMSANGIRNIIHDDFDNIYNGVTVIKNCHLTGDTNIIAGGLGLHETVIIENCYIERTSGSATYDFSYHNNGNAGAQSLLIVKNNYLSRGFSVRWYGPSTLLTDVLVNGNSMANDIDFHAENASATIENINLKSWNNEIRTV